MTKNGKVEIVGWIGVICIVTAFALITLGVLSADSLLYLTLNIVGSIAIIFEAANKKDYQPVVLNIVWATIALVGIFRAII